MKPGSVPHAQEHIDPEREVLAAIADTFATRDDVALVYGFALRTKAVTDWRKVNEAIIERWSPAGLEYVKREAWKKAKAQVRILASPDWHSPEFDRPLDRPRFSEP